MVFFLQCLRFLERPLLARRWPIAWSVLFVVTMSCNSFNSKGSEDGLGTGPMVGSSATIAYRPYPGDGISAADGTRFFSPILAAASLQQADPELLLALGQCECAEGAAGAVLKSLVTHRGALPQFLVPSVRDQIRNNPQLQTLLNLPLGLGNILQGIFASDAKIAEKIRAGLSEKVAKATGNDVAASGTAFVFDGFVDYTADTPTGGFDVSAQAKRWSFVFGQSALWTGGAGLAGNGNGLQAIAALQILSDFRYLLGLAPNPNGGFYGGLTVDPRALVGSPLTKFDPRIQVDEKRTITGKYQVTFPTSASALDLALKAKETWTRSGDEITLAEQAVLWSAGALIFKRLRPENRAATAKMFGPEPDFVLPLDTHRIALSLLPGLQFLTGEPFVDKDTRQVFQTAKLTPAVAGAVAPLAVPTSQARLIRALMSWSIELSNLTAAQLPPNELEKLAKAPLDMKEGVKLGIGNLFKYYFRDQTGVQNGVGYGIARDPNAEEWVSMGEAGEVIATLASAARLQLASPLLREMTSGALHWFAATYFQADRLALQKPSAADIIWSMTAFREAGKAIPDLTKLSWFQNDVAALEGAVKAWSGGVKP